MADVALKSFEDLLENVPKWIADIQAILRVSTDRQNEMLFEKQPTEAAPIPAKKKSKPSSLKSFRSNENTKQKEDEDAKITTPEPTLLRPQLPHMTDSDALRLAQRKRKTDSVCSGDHSGPSKYRSRSMVVVYYDGDVQKKFEELVKAVGVCRNGIRKGKMGAKVDGLSRADSSSSEASSSSSDGEDASFSLHKLGYRSTRAKPVGSALLGHKKDASMVFDKVDGLVDKAQSLCEKAAHQILRDGDCKQELETAMQSFEEAKTQAESEIPALRIRVEKAAERERRSDERRRAQEEIEERERKSGHQLSNTEKQLTTFPPSDVKLEVDLEADDSDGDESDFNAGFDLGHFQMRSTRLLAH
ncbi:hypothetical protein NU219Hw_g8199t1 [Hortaea werneckii]